MAQQRPRRGARQNECRGPALTLLSGVTVISLEQVESSRNFRGVELGQSRKGEDQ